MSDKIARVCDYCGKIDTLEGGADSNGMILVQGDGCCLLSMRDMKKGEIARPTFRLSHQHFCPECLIKAIQDWLKKAA